MNEGRRTLHEGHEKQLFHSAKYCQDYNYATILQVKLTNQGEIKGAVLKSKMVEKMIKETPDPKKDLYLCKLEKIF